MARPIREILLEEVLEIRRYLIEAHQDTSRWYTLIDESAGRTTHQDAWEALMLIPTAHYCPITEKHLPEMYRVSICADPEMLNEWIGKWLTKNGRTKVLNAIRQKKHSAKHSTRSTKLSILTHRRLAQLAKRHEMTIDEMVSRLIDAAKNNPKMLDKQ
ncbi:hypothetical protein [Chromobacterium haemolyticum]|uniref:hypothetical protein n=1 Tax=Chromobacterium haemolyticum TaxID=394935 RepID=UPI00244BA245|nr:hypothetical protein [Chromobacterium haemolyticum]MDH0341990.1 hypothetical protein [Chromobacterium haemolyticum]